MSKRLERAISVWTRSAISIQASDRDEWSHKQAGHTEAPAPALPNSLKNRLLLEGRPHTDIHDRISPARQRPFVQATATVLTSEVRPL